MRTLKLSVIALVLAALVLAVGCGEKRETGDEDEDERPAVSAKTAPAPPTASASVRHQLKGKVISVDKDAQQIVVDHETIPGFMAAMTMPYPVKDAKVLNELKAGDQITADVVVSDGVPRLENVILIKKGRATK